MSCATFLFVRSDRPLRDQRLQPRVFGLRPGSRGPKLLGTALPGGVRYRGGSSSDEAPRDSAGRPIPPRLPAKGRGGPSRSPDKSSQKEKNPAPQQCTNLWTRAKPSRSAVHRSVMSASGAGLRRIRAHVHAEKVPVSTRVGCQAPYFGWTCALLGFPLLRGGSSDGVRGCNAARSCFASQKARGCVAPLGAASLLVARRAAVSAGRCSRVELGGVGS